ncbi:MAG: hypothetical protein IPK50_11880 [Fibrobacterota bacterium]|nr:hypothetical protein [Fibrobacterota bacterium]QQS07570.1 MAG: hypothetical protein IPK50_11880 [Fibrobacterota bacterium]
MFRSPLLVVGFVSLLSLGGCAEYLQEVRRDACIPQRMYERGYNDARAGYGMKAPGGCEDTSVLTRYREGYLQARAQQERQSSLDSRNVVESQALPPTVQVVNANHAKGVVVVNAPSPPAKGAGNPRESQLRQDSLRAWGQRSWLCRAEAFDKNFSAWGPDRSSAQQKALSACTARYGEMFCKEAVCEANSAPATRGPALHRCRVEAFGRTFSGEGTTDLDAKEATRNSCLDRFGVKFCSDISCAMVP